MYRYRYGCLLHIQIGFNAEVFHEISRGSVTWYDPDSSTTVPYLTPKIWLV